MELPSTAAGPAPRISDPARLRALVGELTAIDRPSASEGEREAAEWVVGRLAELGAEARIETERAHGTYWWPLGLGAGAAAVAGLAAARGRRLLGAGLGAATAAALANEFPPAGRRLRSRLPSSLAHNVICELGPAEAEHTVVIVAHHDAAHSGWIFSPAIPELVFERAGVPVAMFDTSPALMLPLLASPLLALGSALSGRRSLGALGALLGAGYAASMAEIGARGAVAGANDNATAVVLLLALAERLLAEPTTSARVILLSTGAEESFSEGMKAFGERHFVELPRERTFFLCVDSVGSPTLNVLRGEGFLRMRQYPDAVLELVDGLADELGIELVPNLRLRNGTDGLEPLAAGYPTATLCSVTELKQPANYHWHTDTAENVDYGTLADAIRLAEAVVRRLDQRWL